MIKTIDLTKKYKNCTAVDRLNLHIEKGELFALLGVNGSGKTTTIKMLSGLTQPTSGEIYLGCEKHLIGVSPQETALAPNLTVNENLELMCGIYDLPKSSVQTLAEQFHLQEILSKKAGKLSGGFQRRLSLAMALISEPKILFLDEPTLGLDVIARSELWDIIRSLKGKVTIILTTHYMEEAEALSDRIGILKNGKLLTVGTAAELMQKTGTDKFEQAFISLVKEAQI